MSDKSQHYTPASEVDRGRVDGNRIVFPPWRGDADLSGGQPPSPLPPEKRIGFAVVGLGRLSLQQIIPALATCGKARLAALVSGSPVKLALTARQYGIPDQNCHDYENFDRLVDNRDVDVVYIVLPNAMHREFTERAARAGKHVLCEKPMATSVADAEAMIAACAAARVKLMIAYRIQYQPHNRHMLSLVRNGRYGRLVSLQSVNVQTVAENGADQWRHKRAMSGGGSLPDIGLYCLNTARFLTGEEPYEVSAQQFSPEGDPRYAEVEETMSFTMRLPSGTLVQSLTSYGAREDKYYRLNFERATVELRHAYDYKGQRLFVSRKDGTMTEETEIVIAAKDQFAAEMEHMATCILEGRQPNTPGEEGLQDQKLMEAIYDAARTGQPLALPLLEGRDLFRSPPST